MANDQGVGAYALNPAPAGAAERADARERLHLPALDGIRFLAAFCVLCDHGYWFVVLQQTDTALDPISNVMRQISSLGMTLFFVLSGFVIHLNYHHSAGFGGRGTRNFWIARFSRLYPLFFLVFMVDFIHLLWLQGYLRGHPQLNFDLFVPLPSFLSLTQSWLFIPLDGAPLYASYVRLTGNVQATGVMWSLSVEWLFYLVYPTFSFWLSRRAGRSLTLVIAAAAAVGLLYYLFVAYHRHAIEAFGASAFGSESLDRWFFSWMAFNGPIGPFTEFLLGAATAQLYIMLRQRGERFSYRPNVTTMAIAGGIVGWMIFIANSHSPLAVPGLNASLISALVACFVLLSVVHKTPISKLLSTGLFVKGGEASYSLYLIHFYTMHEWAAPYAAGMNIYGRVAVYGCAILVTLALARLVYLYFERPALRWLRGNFRPLKLHLVIGATFTAVTLFCILASMQIRAVGCCLR